MRRIDDQRGSRIGCTSRGSARTRIVPITYEGFAPEAGMAVMAGEKNVGTLGSTAAGRGLAMLRLDRVEDAMATGTPLTAGGIVLRVLLCH